MITTQASIDAVSFTPSIKAFDFNWYAVQTFPRHEKAVADHLQNEGLECLLPLVVRVHKWTDRKQNVSLPLFPGYAFVRLNESRRDRVRVLRRPGVVRFVGTSQGPIPLEEHEIDHLRQLMEHRVNCEPHPFVQVGQKVRIRNGALRGIEGILVRGAGKESLILSVSLIQRSLSIQIEGYDLEVL
ncbi:MAG: transcription termination/antitermination protein NusG [Candidatus Acidiferrales bacterium]